MQFHINFQAEDGSGLPEEILDSPSLETAAKLYFIFIRFDIIWTLNYFALHSFLNFFVSVTLIILIVHTLFPLLYEGTSLYWKSHVNKIKLVSLLILAADLVVDILYLSPVAVYSLPLRIAPYIRVVFFILNIRDLRDSLVVLGGMVGTYLNVLVCIVASVSFVLQLLVKQVCWKDEMRKRILKRAFDLIDKDGVGHLDKEQCIILFKELNAYRTLPKISEDDFGAIFDELDDSHDFKINAQEFNDLCNAIALKFQQEDTEPWLKKFPFYNSSLSENLKTFVKSTILEYVVAAVLLLNLVAVIIETTLDIQNNSGQKFWQKVEFVFGWIYVVEMALKVYTYGFENYWKDSQNRFDFIVTWVIVIGETATFVSPTELTFISNGEWIRYLLIARMLRLIRLLMHVKRYRAFIATFLTLIPSLMPYLGTVFCVMCIYCTLGIQVFGGLVNAGNSDLPNTEMADSEYPLDYAKLSGTVWSYAYFVSFYLITVLLLLNLIVAFVLEAFFAELDLECPEEEEENKAPGTGPRGRRNIGTKTRSQRVDMLLHHMLSAELKPSPPATPAP
ncbi:two pore calcium channel protein 1 isoform X2 [Tanacetum coccineum]